MLTPELLLALKIFCWANHVNPAFALGVAHVESGTKHAEFRVGRLGHSKYYGPMGIHRDFLKKWRIDDPKINLLVGVKALKGSDEKRVLRRYNATCDAAYIKAVLAAKKKYQRELGD